MTHLLELLIETREAKDSRVHPGLAIPSPTSKDSPDSPGGVIQGFIRGLLADLEPWDALNAIDTSLALLAASSIVTEV